MPSTQPYSRVTIQLINPCQNFLNADDAYQPYREINYSEDLKDSEESDESEEEDGDFQEDHSFLDKLIDTTSAVDSHHDLSCFDDFDSIANEERYDASLWKPDPTTKLPPKDCLGCFEVHSPSEMCHGHSCTLCYSKCHIIRFCPYKKHVPKGFADFDHTFYEVRCKCGFLDFDTVEWACRGCGRVDKAKLWRKVCMLCSFAEEHDHSTHECPTIKDDPAALAELKRKLGFK